MKNLRNILLLIFIFSILICSCKSNLGINKGYKVSKSDSLVYKYDLDDKILSITEYSDGNQNGITIYFYKEGLISDYVFYKSGKLNGLYKHYFETGAINYICEYKNNKLYNVILVKDSDGNNLDFGDFKNGNGLLKKFYSNGNVKEIGEYKNGCKHGIWVYYYNNGLNLIEKKFENGFNKDLPDFSFCYY